MEMDRYAPGTPCWIDIGVPDIDIAVAFYGALFGWEFDDEIPDAGGYRQARLRGRPVAGIGPQTGPGLPFWSTYISVADVDDSNADIVEAGGQIVVAPTPVYDFGRMGVYTDVAGTAFSTWQAGSHPGCGIVNEPGTLAWNELTTRDHSSAKVFYGRVFGWTADDKPMGDFDYTEWQADGRSVGGMMPMVGPMWPAEIPNHWMVYFGSADTDASCARVLELGGSVPVPPFETPAGRIAVANDPAGGHFSLITLSAERAG